MALLPVVDRELRVAARKAATHWMRLGAALAAILVWFICFWSNSSSSPSALGHSLFVSVAILLVGGCIGAGPFITADLLSEEKRSGTLGLLFLTPLRVHHVLLGKLAGSSLHAVFALVAALPVLTLPLLIGGVTMGEFVRVVIVLLLTVLWSCLAGLFESARTEDAHAALGRALAWTIGLAGFLPLCYWLVNLGSYKLRAGVYTTGHDLALLLWPSPGFAVWSALEPTFTLARSGSAFWQSCATILGTALLFLIGSFVRLKRSVLEVPEQTFAPPPKADLRRDHQPLGMKNPFDWLATRSRWSRRVLIWIFGFLAPLCALTYLVALLPPNGPGSSLLICIVLMYVLHQTFKIVLAIEGSRQFNQDRQSRALELILATPLTIDAILAGQLQSLRARFNPVAAILTTTNSLFLICTLLARDHFELNHISEWIMFLTTVIGGITLLWFDYSALTWLSMWRGLSATKHHRSVLSTLGSIMALPWFCIFLLFVGVGDKIESEAAGTRCILFWIALSIAIDLYFRAKAKKQLQRHFRNVVAEGSYMRSSATGRSILPGQEQRPSI